LRSRTFWGFVAVFWVIYLAAAGAIGTTKVAGRFDALFGADQPRVHADLAGGGKWFGMRTDVHPLFPIMFNPAGRVLRLGVDLASHLALKNDKVKRALEARAGEKGFGETLEALRTMAAATLLNTFAGAITVGLVWHLLRRLGVGAGEAIGFGVLYGVSASAVFWGGVCETHTFSALFLVLMMLGVAGGCLSGWRAWVIGVGSFGINASNLALHLIAVFFGPVRGRPVVRRVLGAGLAGVVILVIAAGLSLAQRLTYRQTELFFAPSNVHKETIYLASTAKDSPGRRAAVVAAHQVLFDFVAPRTYVTQRVEVTNLPKIGFRAEGRVEIFRAVGLAAAVGWVGLVLFSLLGVRAFFRETPGVAWALLGGVVFNFVLFAVYGRLDEQFLYAPNCVPFVLVFVAAAGAAGRQSPGTLRRVYGAVVFCTAGLIAVNTVLLLLEVRAL
jgi:hypothetical protein